MKLHSAALLLVILPSSLPAQVRDLKAFYRERCAVCHGSDGAGRGPGGVRLGPRSLAEARLARLKDDDLVAVILKGRAAMPGFARQLPEAEARRLVVEVVRPMAGRRRP